MSLVRDFIELITVHPGALVYHLVTLFAIQLIAGVALGHWQRQRDEAATRMLVMGIGLFLARTILMIAAVLDTVGLVSSTVILPPLERFLHLVTSLLVVWAFLPILEQNRRLSTLLLLLTTLIAAGTYAAFASLWPEAEAQGIVYNGYWQERVWNLATTVILGASFIASLMWRGHDWGWLVCLLALWLVGHILQLVAPTSNANTAGWVRLANLVGLPLLAALTYRRALGPTNIDIGEAEDASTGTVGFLEAVQLMKTGGSLESGLRLAAPAITRIMDADMVALGLSVPGPVAALRVTALHPATRVSAGTQEPILVLSEHPLLATAFRDQRLQRASAGGKPTLLEDLYRHLGFDGSGPLLVQPVMAGEEVLGLILVGNPKRQRTWSPQDEQTLQAVAYVLSSAVTRESISEEQWVRVRKEVQRMAERAEDLEARLEQQRERSEELSTKLRLREREAAEQKRASAALAVWQEAVRELAEGRDELQTKLFQWQRRAESLSQAKSELEERLAQVGSATSLATDGQLRGILVGDEQGAVILASREVHRLLGRSRPELMAARFQDLFDEPQWKETVFKLLKESPELSDVTAIDLNRGDWIVRIELAHLPPSERWPRTVVALLYVEGAVAEDAGGSGE